MNLIFLALAIDQYFLDALLSSLWSLKMRRVIIVGTVGFGLLAGCSGQEAKDALNSFEWGKPEIVVNPNAEEEALAEYLCDQYGNCN
jgi:hypothetical protein